MWNKYQFEININVKQILIWNKNIDLSPHHCVTITVSRSQCHYQATAQCHNSQSGSLLQNQCYLKYHLSSQHSCNEQTKETIIKWQSRSMFQDALQAIIAEQCNNHKNQKTEVLNTEEMCGLCYFQIPKKTWGCNHVNNDLRDRLNCLICGRNAKQIKSETRSKLLDSVYVTETVTY